MSAKRSPILGYNHNVRYRGIVFHVQTEDSGLANPHVFSHLFHGGVIISTRKLVYDRDAAEDVVKSLMQAQHKAMMKDLKHRFFDEKIDQYLGGAPGLLPREVAGAPAARTDETAPSPKFDDETPPAGPPPSPPIPDAVGHEISEPVIELVDAATTIPMAVVHDVLPTSGMPGAFDGPLARAATQRVSGAVHPPLATHLGSGDISEAMSAIQVGDDELAAAGLVEVQEVAQVHSPAPPSVTAPPGVQPERPGQYSVKRGSGPIEKFDTPPPAGGGLPRPPIPRPTPPSNKLPTASAGSVPPRPTGQHAAVQPPIARPTPTAVPRINPAGSPVPRPGTQPASAARTRAPSGGGVVVSRPPVIVGGPSKAVGTPAGQGKVRRAKDTDGGIGGDLISERSLDEVILAYLSEDTSDE
ncbi:MAG TPA: hypothetical protein VM261_39485 [Kofleriaceae bacterium]|nr:hypothetical protein [Kofleriaceae bacterium]